MGVVGAGRAQSHSGALRHGKSGQDLGLPLPLPLMRQVRHVGGMNDCTVPTSFQLVIDDLFMQVLGLKLWTTFQCGHREKNIAYLSHSCSCFSNC